MLKCASFFAGVGGIDIGFENTNAFKIIYANEIDKYPVKTYELNSKLSVDSIIFIKENILDAIMFSDKTDKLKGIIE